MKQTMIFILLAALVLCAVSGAFSESENWDILTEIEIRIDDRIYDGFLYDNAAGKFMAEQLPYTVHLNKGEIDYCGSTDLEFENRGFDSRGGYEKGELLYFRGWFVIFLNERLPLEKSGDYVPFGRLSDSEDADDMLENAAASADVIITKKDKGNDDMKMMIGNTAVQVAWENNGSVDALKELTAAKPLTIQMSMYGGFEQVGPIGQSLPRNDVQTVTNSGDIVLYSGNQIVVFYGSNSWAYTRLGYITDKTQGEMAALLGNGNVTITLGR